jgi:hypothetical protein
VTTILMGWFANSSIGRWRLQDKRSFDCADQFARESICFAQDDSFFGILAPGASLRMTDSGAAN